MKEGVSKKGICQKCGCTWETPCIDEKWGCCWWVWVDHDETICSHCFWKLNEEEIRHYEED